MKTYADSSLFVSLYLSDANGDKAIAEVRRLAEPLPFSPLHRHEFRNAIRLATWRKVIEPSQRQQILRSLDEDLRSGFFAHQAIAWTQAFQESERIGVAITERIGIRAVDLLHLGVAASLGAEEFLTFDSTQRKAALAAGFKCKP